MRAKFLLGLAVGIMTAGLVYAQPNWKRVNYETSTVFTGFVKIENQNASPNDMIGIFVNGECRMVAKVIMVNDSSFVSAVIHSNGGKEVAQIKYWNSTTNTVHAIDTTVEIDNHAEVKRFPIVLKAGELPTPVVSVKEESLRVFPSPFTNVINVVSSKEIKSVNVFNSIGTNVAKQTPQDGSFDLVIPADKLKTGMYLVLVETADGKVETKKIFKK